MLLFADVDLQFLTRAAELADASAGLTQPHPNAGCVLVSADGAVVAETHQRAQASGSTLPCSRQYHEAVARSVTATYRLICSI